MPKEPFNIKIAIDGSEVTLTILPTDKGYYKVIYFGGVLGAITNKNNGKWALVPEDEVEAGDLPPYHHDLESGEAEVVLNEDTINLTGAGIEHGSGL